MAAGGAPAWIVRPALTEVAFDPIELRGVRLSRDAAVATITIDSPPVNALAPSLIDELGEALAEVARGPAGVLLIRSAIAPFFSVGADLKSLKDAEPDRFETYVRKVRGAIDAIADFDLPTVAVIEGRALGGGFELALACDVRFATVGSSVGLPEVKIGLLPGAGGTQRLTRALGAPKATEIMLSGREVGAEEAYRLGLVELVETGAAEDAARTWAEAVAGHPRLSVAAIRRCVAAADGPDLAAGFETELREISDLYRNGDARRRIAGFSAGQR